MGKEFKEKIERNRKNYEKMERSMNNGSTVRKKPRPTTYEYFVEGNMSTLNVLNEVGDNISEFTELANSIYFDPQNEVMYFDKMISAVVDWFYNYCPHLQEKINVYNKLSIFSNGFIVRLGTIELEVRSRYSIVDGVANIDSTTATITLYGKISQESYIAITGEGSPWKKKEITKPVRRPSSNRNNYHKEEKEVAEY